MRKEASTWKLTATFGDTSFLPSRIPALPSREASSGKARLRALPSLETLVLLPFLNLSILSNARKMRSASLRRSPSAKKEKAKEINGRGQHAKLEDRKQRILMAGKTMPVKSRDRGLNSILNSALEHGESNNVLLLGQRPKLESILPAEVTIYLDGILCPTDNIALREIARQMDLISNLEEDATSHGSFQSCFDLVSIIIYLSHTQLIERVNENSQRMRGSRSVLIFVLDNFHLFALQPKQRLLYALFDEVQSSKNCLLVIGATDRTVSMASL